MPATANAVHAFLQREILHMFLITTLYNIIILCLSTEWFLEFNLLSLFLLLAEGTKIRWHEADSEVVGMNEKRAAKWKGKKPNAKWQDLWRHSGTFNPAASSSNQMNVLREFCKSFQLLMLSVLTWGLVLGRGQQQVDLQPSKCTWRQSRSTQVCTIVEKISAQSCSRFLCAETTAVWAQ